MFSEYEYSIPPVKSSVVANSGDSLINTSATNIIAGGGSIGVNSNGNNPSSANNAYNMSFLSSGNNDLGGHPPSRGIGGRKMMAAVASGAIEEASPHSSKHDLILSSSTSNNPGPSNAALYRKRF